MSLGFVSTGDLPVSAEVQHAVDAVHARYAGETGGENSRVYPALEQAESERFGICLVSVDGRVHAAGDVDAPFAIMSVAKPFVFALVCEAIGAERARAEIGVNATGAAFNSLAEVQTGRDGRTNPMVNAGALATTSRIPGDGAEQKWARLLTGLSEFAGRELVIDEEIHASAQTGNHVNRAACWLLHSRGLLAAHPDEVIDLYTRTSSLSVTARDLAVMGATLADGGVNPLTRRRLLAPELCHHVLAVMMTAGLYEDSGDWLYEVGLPGKSGIGGGMVTVSPGKGGLGTYSTPLDPAGNSVRGKLVAKDLSTRIGLDLLASRPTR